MLNFLTCSLYHALPYIIIIKTIKGSVQQPDKSILIKNEILWNIICGRNIFIFVEQSDNWLYYFQRYLKKNYLKVNEIMNFVWLLLNN